MTDSGTIATVLSIVRNDVPKLLRYAAVSAATVPIGLALFYLFLSGDLRPWQANLLSVVLATIPNYLLNRYWVWRKRGPNSVHREIAPFWIMALLGAMLSTTLVWILQQYTDARFVFLAAQVVAFGIVWVAKFFVIERFLFGAASQEQAPVGDLAESTR